jgi:Tfp pilus assembly protein PilO
MNEQKTNYALLFTILVTLAGWGVTFGVCKNQIETNARDIERVEAQHEKDIKKIHERQDNTEGLLQSINAQLIELNTKMTLLLKGDLKTGK